MKEQETVRSKREKDRITEFKIEQQRQETLMKLVFYCIVKRKLKNFNAENLGEDSIDLGASNQTES